LRFARAQLATGDLEAADQTLRRVEDALRTVPEAMFLRGVVRSRRGDLAQARDLLGRYVFAAPGDRAARRLYAAVLLDLDLPRDAIEALGPVTDPDSQDVASLALLSSAQLRARDVLAARRTFERIARSGSQREAAQAQSFLAVLGAQGDDAAALERALVLDDLRFNRLDPALTRAKAMADRDPAAREVLAAVHVARGEEAAARAAYAALLADDPGSLAAATGLDRLDVRAGDTAAVEARLRQRLAAAPGEEATLLRLAGLLQRDGRAAEAQQLLREAAGRLPQSLPVRVALAQTLDVTADREEAARLGRELRAIGTAGDLRGLEAAATIAAALGEPAQAVADYKLLAEKLPDSTPARLALARAQYAAGDRAGARATLDAVLARSPGQRAAASGVVELELQDGRTDAALAFARGQRGQDRELAAGLESRALLAAGRPAEAVAALERAFEAGPSPALAASLFLTRRQAGQAEAAVQGLRSWVRQNPDDAGALQLLSEALIGEKDYAAAGAALELAVQLVPTSPLLLNNLAWVRAELGRGGAIEMARRAHQLAPQSPEIADTLGWLLARSGQLDEGVRYLREAAEAAPQSPDIRYHLAWALAAKGERDEARRLVEQALASEAPFAERQAAEGLAARLR
jgi:putative PEP-CTERM system TPR-repeat lipoprotein